MTDSPPAMEGSIISHAFANHLSALHSARQAYSEAESSEKIRRALRHKVRANSEHFDTGCKVYYKRDDSNKWRGPGVVIGQDRKIVFVRHGNVYVRVSINRLMKCGQELANAEKAAISENQPASDFRKEKPDDCEEDEIRTPSTEENQIDDPNGNQEHDVDVTSQQFIKE